MDKRLILAVVFGALNLFTLCGNAEAHLRDYIFNQGYYTSSKGEVELEFYNDFNMPNKDADDTYNSKHQAELEFGVTDHLQLAIYDVATWNRRDDWQQSEWKFEAKYRLLEAGELPVDTTLYAEYISPNGRNSGRSDEVELKLILSKNFGDWNVTGNLITKREINKEDPWDFEYTLGTRYPVLPKMHLGLELKESIGTSNEFGPNPGNHKLQLMPLVGFSPTPKTRILFGPAFGLTRNTDDIQLKTIASIEF